MSDAEEPSIGDNKLNGFQTKPLDDGRVEISFLRSGKEVLKGQLTAAEVGNMVTGLLTSSYYAFHDNGGIPNPAVTQIAVARTTPTTHWFLGKTNTVGQRAIAAQVGQSVVGFTIANDRIREFGRMLVAGSWKTDSTDSATRLLAGLLRDFFNDMRAWILLARSRIDSDLRKRGTSLRMWITGRSFRLFRVVKFHPNLGFASYKPVRQCIYCGATVYSERPGLRRHPLGGEHIIAEGLGGTLELPEASCQECEEITGSVVENDVLAITLKALRAHLKIRGKKRKPPPTTLPLTRTDVSPEKIEQIPTADYPMIFMLPIYGPPGIFFGGSGGNQMTTGMRFVTVSYDERKMRKVYGITSFATPRWDTHMLFRMLGKIGHSFAAAELPGKFSPALTDMIRKGTPELFNYIGGDPVASGGPGGDALHEIGLGYQRARGKDYVVARIRLFSKQGGPVYYVVVGESLEHPIAKLRRLLSRRISLMLAR